MEHKLSVALNVQCKYCTSWAYLDILTDKFFLPKGPAYRYPTTQRLSAEPVSVNRS